MRIFALETDVDKLKQNFLSHDEKEILMINFHWLRIIPQAFWSLIITILFSAAVIGLMTFGVAPLPTMLIAVFFWACIVLPKLIRAYIDWKYDFAMLTTDKIVIVDQSSIFKQKVTPINLENFSHVSAETQWGNLFSFGILHLDLLEGAGAEYKLKFIKQAQIIAPKIAETLMTFQRRKDLQRIPDGPKASHGQM